MKVGDNTPKITDATTFTYQEAEIQGQQGTEAGPWLYNGRLGLGIFDP